MELTVPLMNGREFSIPTEAFVGWNWAYAYDENKKLVNPNGLVPYGSDNRTQRSEATGLDRVLLRSNV
jgi:hypothetical protein